MNTSNSRYFMAVIFAFGLGAGALVLTQVKQTNLSTTGQPVPFNISNQYQEGPGQATNQYQEGVVRAPLKP
jgi:hypothetical protein